MEKTNFLKNIDKDKAFKIAHIVYAVLIVALAIVVGVLFIVNVVDIKNSSDMSPFTTDAIESHFRAIAVPVILFPVLVIAGFVLHFVFPLDKKQTKIENNKALATLSSKVNLDLVDSTSKIAIVRERYFRLATVFGSALIWINALVLILVFTLNKENYVGTQVNESVKDLALVVFPSSLIAIGISYVVSIVNHLSKKRELEQLKNAVKLNKEVLDGNGKSGLHPLFDKIYSVWNTTKAFISENEKVSLWVLRGIVFVVAIVLIILGIINGGMEDVLAKAIRICTECIGLG